MDRGIFITFEGIEGAGKSTQVKIFAEKISKDSFKTITTFEPGDTELGKKIREILLSPTLKINPLNELLLYFVDRIQHVWEKVNPLLSEGFLVISDRFIDSTLAYQGYGRGISIDLINKLNKILLNDFKPDLTILLDLPAEQGLARNKNINKHDKFEIEDISFHNRVREGFLRLASLESERFIVIDATKTIDEVSYEIYEKTKERLKMFKI
jgi:dTMP kinase